MKANSTSWYDTRLKMRPESHLMPTFILEIDIAGVMRLSSTETDSSTPVDSRGSIGGLSLAAYLIASSDGGLEISRRAALTVFGVGFL